jgi:NitT/TauT family transport system ATP-binding protein
MAQSEAHRDSPAPTVECSQLTVSFPKHGLVLDDLDLHVHSGKIVSLLGPSGCGKSTLLRCVAGLQCATKGDIRVGGLAPKVAQSSMSFVFQDPTLLPWRSIRDNVVLPLELHSQLSKTEARQKAVEILITVGLALIHHSKRPAELSGGMKMRASIARALVTDPNLLLLDEPFAALDDMLRGKLNELLLELWAQRQRTILFVTHNIAESVFLSHRIALLMNGKIREWIDVPFGYPRKVELRSDPAFMELCVQIASRFAGESNASQSL